MHISRRFKRSTTARPLPPGAPPRHVSHAHNYGMFSVKSRRSFLFNQAHRIVRHIREHGSQTSAANITRSQSTNSSREVVRRSSRRAGVQGLHESTSASARTSPSHEYDPYLLFFSFEFAINWSHRAAKSTLAMFEIILKSHFSWNIFLVKTTPPHHLTCACLCFRDALAVMRMCTTPSRPR